MYSPSSSVIDNSTVDLYNFSQSLYLSSCTLDKSTELQDGPAIEKQFDRSASSCAEETEMCQSLSETNCRYPNSFFDDLFYGGESNGMNEQGLDLVVVNSELDLNQVYHGNDINSVLDNIGLDWVSDRAIDLGNVFTNIADIDTGPTLAKLNELKEEPSEEVFGTRYGICTAEKQRNALITKDSVKCVVDNSLIYTEQPSVFATSSGTKSSSGIKRPYQPLRPIQGDNVRKVDGKVYSAQALVTHNLTEPKSTSNNCDKEQGASQLAKLLLTPSLKQADYLAQDVLANSERCNKGEKDQSVHEPCTIRHDQLDHCDQPIQEEQHDNIDAESVQRESDHNYDSDDSSDSNDDTASDCGSWTSQELLPEQRSSRKKKYFWEYNIHGKKKLKNYHVGVDVVDHHILSQYVDPVFNPKLREIDGVRHDGKARRGDGNDLTPNPAKLHRIGLQLQKINADINSIHVTPLGELPTASKDSTRKQKNKLASRACRLKKKAQHEANKVKLYGLDQEHEGLMHVLNVIKSQIHNIEDSSCHEVPLTTLLSNEIATHLGEMVAGNTTQYVNAAIQKVERGDKMGGLRIAA